MDLFYSSSGVLVFQEVFQSLFVKEHYKQYLHAY